MTDPRFVPPDHTDHERFLIAGLVGGALEPAERSEAEALTRRCIACAELADDLRSLATATARLPAPRRSRDFRLSPADAQRLRGGSRVTRLAGLGQRLSSPRFGLLQPLGGAVLSIGVALVLVGTITSPSGTFQDDARGGGATGAASQALSGAGGGPEAAASMMAGDPGAAASPGVAEVDGGASATGQPEGASGTASRGSLLPVLGASPPAALATDAAEPSPSAAASVADGSAVTNGEPPSGPAVPATTAGASPAPVALPTTADRDRTAVDARSSPRASTDAEIAAPDGAGGGAAGSGTAFGLPVTAVGFLLVLLGLALLVLRVIVRRLGPPAAE